MEQTAGNDFKLNRAGQWYDRCVGKWLPRYALFSLPACFVLNCAVYWGAQELTRNARAHDLTTALDRTIPFRPEWVSVYFACFVFWAVSYILIARQGKENWFRFAAADMLSRCVCGVFFVVFPTTNVRPPVPGGDLWSVAVRLLYTLDRPANLFPSIHCLVSWLCYIAVRGNAKIPRAYRAFCCAAALAVFASTLLIRQHVIADVIGGVLLAEACFFFSGKTGCWRGWARFFARLDRLIFGEKPCF